MSRELSALTSYSQVLSCVGKGGQSGSFSENDRGLDDKFRQSLSFEYDFSNESQAIEDLKDWNKRKVDRDKKKVFFDEMLGSHGGDATPSPKPVRPPRPVPTNPTATKYVEGIAVKTTNDPSAEFATAYSADGIDRVAIAQFKEYTGATESQSIHYLRAYDWDVNTAVKVTESRRWASNSVGS